MQFANYIACSKLAIKISKQTYKECINRIYESHLSHKFIKLRFSLIRQRVRLLHSSFTHLK